MIKKNGGIFGRNPTYNDVVVEGVLTLKEAQVFDNDITINGDLTVNGTETVINTVELNVDDKNITMGAVVAKVGLTSTSNITLGQFTVLIADTAGLVPGMTVTKTAGTGAFAAGAKIASVDSHYQITLDLAHTASGSITFDTGGATDFTADGGGITLKGLTDKFIKWVKSTAAWTFSDKIEAPDVTVTNLTASLPVFTDANKKLVTQSQQNALNAIAGATTAARFLRGDGTNVSMSAIQASDVPTLNQSTTGSAGSVKSNATTGVLQVAGPTAGTTRVMTTPDANFTAARTDAAQTFTGAQTFGNIKLDTNTVSTTAGALSIIPTGTNLVNIFGNTPGARKIGVNTDAPTEVFDWRTAASATWKFRNDAAAAGAIMKISLQHANTFSGASEGYITLKSMNPGNSSADLALGVNADGGGAAYDALYIAGNGGDVQVKTGNLVISTSGKGIDFSATADGPGKTSELLADYEEGTWTPDIGAWLSPPTVSYTSRSGTYTKIGRQVTAHFQMTINTISGGSGQVAIAMPFTPANDICVGSARLSGVDWAAGYTSVTLNTTAIGALVVIGLTGDNVAYANAQIGDFGAGDTIYGTITFHV